MAEEGQKLGNRLHSWGNEATMNLNSMVLTNIQSSPYFKVTLFNLKTYHEVVDEIYYKVRHLEPWEKGSRKTQGQTGMCGGVRGVGAGGIVSSAYCLLYKLYTLKLTRKQLQGLINHADSPYIRGLGFMYIRYCQPPKDLWDWFEPYLDDEEEIDVKAGGGCNITIGEVIRQFIMKLEWYGTLFPRIPVPIQKMIDQSMKERQWSTSQDQGQGQEYMDDGANANAFNESDQSRSRSSRHSSRERDPPRNDRNSFRKKTPPFDIAKAIDDEKSRQRNDQRSRSKSRDHKRRSRSRERRSRSRDRHQRSHDRNRHSRHRDKHPRHKQRSRSRDRKRSRSLDKPMSHHRSGSRERNRHR